MADRELRKAIEFRDHRRLEMDPQSDGETRTFARNREMSQLDLFDAPRLNEKIVETLPLLLWIFDLGTQSLVYINALICDFLAYPLTASSSPPSVDHTEHPLGQIGMHDTKAHAEPGKPGPLAEGTDDHQV